MREKMLFDSDWKFHEGDIEIKPSVYKGTSYQQAKTERFRYGPACRDYIDTPDDYNRNCLINPDKWEYVTLPHDYIIKQTPSEDYNNALGYFKYQNAWYRKGFTLNKDDMGKRICLYFEGIATHSTIYLNGCPLKRNYCGYTSFEVDITDFADFDRENVLAVYIQTNEHEGWWYEGAGIYRHVWLVKTDNTAVDLYGTYIKPQKTGDVWNVSVQNTIRNDFYEEKQLKIVTCIMDGDDIVATMQQEITVNPREKFEFDMQTHISNPHLWSIDDPHQYKAVTQVMRDGAEVDRYETKFGFRWVSFDNKNRFMLNGKRVQINGVCAHQDFGLTGKAVSDNIHRYKLQMIKEMGANGYRCSHYAHSEVTMDALDEMGFIVMNETRWFDSSEEGIKQIQMLVKRDRNRPSVFFWSVLNEEPMQSTENGRRICKNLIAEVKKLDDTRLITAAVDLPSESTVYDDLDIIGINYNLEKYDEVHKKYPNKPIFASECCATGTTRDWYFDTDISKGYLNAFDRDTTHYFRGRENTYKFFGEREWIFGSYQWMSVEHRGECVWPSLCSKSGAIDLFLQKKDAFYQNQSFWITKKPVIHILPYWNFKGREGEKMRVGVYSNCEAVELFLNGISLGRQNLNKYDHGEWSVEYQAGELSAVGYKDGKIVAKDIKTTSNCAVALKFKLDNNISAANGTDIAVFTCYCVDENNNVVPDASPCVEFCSNSLGKIIATGSDVCDHIPVNSTVRKMYQGKITVAVKVGTEKGTLTLYGKSDNLNTGSISVDLQN